MIRSVIKGCGSYLPEKRVTNEDMSKIIETNDEWIVQRTGIKARHFAADDQTTSAMAVIASKRALEHAGVSADEIDCIILATTTPDKTFPATAVLVQSALGMKDRGFAFDVQAVCSGFVYAMAVADNFIKAGQVKKALVIGAEKLSNLLNWDDRTTCVLFGDGAGAVVLEAVEINDGDKDVGIISTHLHSEGDKHVLLYANGGPGSTRTTGYVVMDGKEVYKNAVIRMSEVVTESLKHNGLTGEDIDWLVPHQANKRIIDSTAEKLKLPENKVVITVHEHGNTSSASIPLALDSAVKDGRIQKGDLLLMETMGGGLTWGAAVLRF